MKKSFLSKLAIMSVLGTTLVGCASQPTTNETEGNKTPTAKEDVVITIIQNKVEIQELLEEAIAEFNETHEGITVKALGSAGDSVTTLLQTQFASAPEKAPTIFSTSGGAEMDKFLPYMEPLDSTKASTMIADGQEGDARRDGKLYGLPVALEGFGIIYNKDLFEQAGINPDDIKTMDDLVAACEALEGQDGVKSALAFAKESYFKFMHPFNWPFAMMENPAEVIAQVNSGDLLLKDIPELQSFVADLDKVKPYTNLGKSTYDEQIAGFAMGEFAMIHQGNWAQSIITDYDVEFDYGFLPLPISGNQSLSVGNSNFYRVNSHVTPEQKEAAFTFLDWLFTEEAGQRYITEEFKWIPPYNGFDTSTMDKLSQEVSKYSEAGKTLPWVFDLFPAGAHQEFANQMEKYYADIVTGEGLLDELNKVWMEGVK